MWCLVQCFIFVLRKLFVVISFLMCVMFSRFSATWETAYGVDVSSTKSRVHGFTLDSWMTATSQSDATCRGPVCEGDILTLLESELNARRFRWYVCIRLVCGSSPIWSSIQVHTDGVGGIPNVVVQWMLDSSLWFSVQASIFGRLIWHA